jgi:predicted aldo/keto reductase-like oxidoreductase
LETRIKSIIEEDLKAQETYRLAQEKIKDALMNIHKEKTHIQDEVWNKAKKEVDDEKNKLTAQLEKAQADSVFQYQTALKILEDDFKAREKKWHDELLARCLNQDIQP